MKIAAVSDTHSYHNMIKEFPQADVFVHTGDMTQLGKWYDMVRFKEWLLKLPYEHKLILAGNHDFCLQDKAAAIQFFSEVPGAHYMHEEEIVIEGVKFYGTAWQPIFFDWAFNTNEAVLEQKYAQIPEDTNILLTHCPPLKMLDIAGPIPRLGRFDPEHTGSKALMKRVQNLSKLQVHFFGHIHESRGDANMIMSAGNNVQFANISMNPQNPEIIVVEI